MQIEGQKASEREGYSVEKGRMKHGFLSLLLIALFLGMVSSTTMNVNAQIPVEITSSDSYEKTIGPEGTATYNWTLTNTDANSTFQVEIIKSESEEGWTTNLNMDFFTLAPGATWTSTLSVSPPAGLLKGEMTVDLNYKISNATGGWNVSVSPAITKVYSVPQVIGLFDNPLPSPLDNKYGVFLLDVLIWTVIVILAYVAFERVIHQLTKRTKTKLDDIIFKIIRRPVIILLVLFGLVSSIDVLDLPRDIVGYVNQAYLIVLILLVTWLAYKLFKDILIYYGRIYAEKTHTQIDDILIPIAEKVGAVIIIVVAIAILLAYTGVDLTMLAVGSIVISMVIAFALQDTLSNFFSGIYLLTDRPFKAGDLILLASGEVCRIEHIGMRSTRVYNTFDHTMIVLPNNMLANDKIVNYTEPDTQFRITTSVGVAYGTDVGKVSGILHEVAEAHPKVLKEPEKYRPLVRFTEFGDSSLNFQLWTWIDNVYDRFEVKTDLNKEIDRRFKEENITIPFPQRTVWMHETKGN
jgi:small-conductance mechanosensitive channel